MKPLFAVPVWLLVILLYLVATPAVSRAGDPCVVATIRGTITDADTGEPLAGVTVVASVPGRAEVNASITGAKGAYRIEVPSGGVYSVTAYFADISVRRGPVSVAPCKSATLDVALVAASGADEAIVISDRAPAIDPSSTRAGRTLGSVGSIPIPGRTFEAALGVATGASFSGSTSLENRYLVNGVNTSELYSGKSDLPDDARARMLTAAIVADADAFDEYVEFQERHRDIGERLDVHLDRRLRVVVRDRNGRPINGARIVVGAGEGVRGMTRADGIWDMFPGLSGAQVDASTAIQVNALGASYAATMTLDPTARSQMHKVVLDVEVPAVRALDLAFAIDVTGSMGDEMVYLAAELRAIVAAVAIAAPQTSIRLGAVLYRDRGDARHMTVHRFTEDVDAFVADLAKVRASGGGDYPEDVNEALRQGLHTLSWRTSEAARILVLLGDAPPHVYPDQNYTYKDAAAEASARGIRILPVAASGADRRVEYLFRALGVATSTPYVHLTDHSGIGNHHLAADTACAPVEMFNDMLRRLIITDLRGDGMHSPPACNEQSPWFAAPVRSEPGPDGLVVGAGIGTTLLTDKEQLGTVAWFRAGYVFGDLELRAHMGWSRRKARTETLLAAQRGAPMGEIEPPSPGRRAFLPGVSMRYAIANWGGVRPFVGGGVEALIPGDGGARSALVFSRFGLEMRRRIGRHNVALGTQLTTPLGMIVPDNERARAPRLDFGTYLDVRF